MKRGSIQKYRANRKIGLGTTEHDKISGQEIRLTGDQREIGLKLRICNI